MKIQLRRPIASLTYLYPSHGLTAKFLWFGHKATFRVLFSSVQYKSYISCDENIPFCSYIHSPCKLQQR